MGFLDPTENKLETDYAEPLRRWQQKPDKYNTGKLLKVIEPEIQRGIFAHVGQANPLIKSRARRMALDALGRYDASKAKLGTHVVNSLQGLKRVNRQQTQILAAPERVVYDKRNLERAAAELEDDLGRAPSLRELADRTGFSMRRITHVQNYQPGAAEGTFQAAQLARGGPSDALVNQRGTADWGEVLYHDLDATNQKIMEWTLGMFGAQQLSNQEIARRLRITPGAVSQRKQRIQRMLDELQDLGGQY